MLNNDSEFGEDEWGLISGYIVIMVIWVGVIIALAKPVIKSVYFSDRWSPLLIYSGYIILGLAYFYRLLNLFIVYSDGDEVVFLTVIYSVIKPLVDGMLVTLLVSIAWGWSLIHLKHESYYMIFGTIVVILNIIAILVDVVSEEIEDVHHQYDGISGIILLLIRLTIFLIFLLGILRSTTETVGKMRYFLKRFGLYGGLYLLAWPIALVFAELFTPNYMHKEVITIMEETAHIIANALMCRLFSVPTSEYQKLCIFEESIIPTYKDHAIKNQKRVYW